jgi:cytochrome c-type biogenesis protein CcmH/NrfF
MKRLIALVLLCSALPLAAQDRMPPAPYAYQQLEDPALEAQARELMETIRCLQCQSQSVGDSDAQIAGDMRHEIRTQIAAGRSPGEVRAWLIERYGDYVSYEPRVSATTWPLFAIPLLLLALAVFIVARRMRRRA